MNARAILLSDVMLPRRNGGRFHWQQAIILRELMMGRRSADQLIMVLWPGPDDEPDYAYNTVRTQICRMRRRLRKGWRINCEYKFGYRLVGPAQ